MKKGFWFGIGLLSVSSAIFAVGPTMKYTSQPSGPVDSLPTEFDIQNLAPIPQDICSPTISADNQKATCSGLPVCKGSSPQTASFSCSVTTSCKSTVSASQDGGDCGLSVNIVKPSSLAASTPFSFTLSYGSYSTSLVSNAFTIDAPPTNSYRTITFKNSCDNPVWFGSITGAAPGKNILTGGAIDCTGASGNVGKEACVAADGACYSRIGLPDACFSQECNTDTDCLDGASCFKATTTTQGKCFWSNPVPDNQSFKLDHNVTNTVKIPENESNKIGVIWSGAFGGRTECTSTTCLSAVCTSASAPADGVCSLGVGFQQPATQAEVTFLTYPTGMTPATVTDAYDVTVINGANVPMAMYPTYVPLPVSNNPYTCGAGGYNLSVPASAPAGDTIGASSWELANSNPPSVAYRYVQPTVADPQKCSVDTDCTDSSSDYCGLSYASIGGTDQDPQPVHQLVCGTFAGWFTADQICGTNNKFTNALGKDGVTPVYNFYCTTELTSNVDHMTILGTMANLYQCNGTNYDNSCYSSGATTDCCGCANWSNASEGNITVPSNTAYVANCVSQNPSWTGSFSGTQPQVYDTLLFLKQACPSCYTYPFDDQSSSFTCTNGSYNVNNTVDYTVEFCPGGAGNTGFQPPAH